MCSKVGYATKEGARAEIRQINYSRKQFSRSLRNGSNKSGKKMRVYLCPHCGEFHITTQKQRKW